MKLEVPRNIALAVHHRQQAMYHMISSMLNEGIIKDDQEFMTKFLPIFELLCDGEISSSEIDDLTSKVREQITEIGNLHL